MVTIAKTAPIPLEMIDMTYVFDNTTLHWPTQKKFELLVLENGTQEEGYCQVGIISGVTKFDDLVTMLTTTLMLLEIYNIAIYDCHTSGLASHTTVAGKCPSSPEDEQEKKGESKDRLLIFIIRLMSPIHRDHLRFCVVSNALSAPYTLFSTVTEIWEK
ncbi:uncharacterized protein TNCV_4680861 [Trichonephila clavipes]|nr:uncharacterized protein TNCV_4680861 [Trichonephila clavipes]